jgi:hypothetical protein
MTAGGPELILISQSQLNSETFGDKVHLVSVELGDDLRRRNLGKPISLAGYKSPSPKILVKKLTSFFPGEESPEEDANARRFRMAGPPDRSPFVIAWLPGYAKDGNTAVFRAYFGPYSHGATLTYKLAKKDGEWTVVWRFVSRYM